MDPKEIDFPDNSFDVFISGEVFSRIPDLDKAFEEICRILKPGGLLVSWLPFFPNHVKPEVLTASSIKDESSVDAPASCPRFSQRVGT